MVQDQLLASAAVADGGNGNATLAAARRFADVVSTDYVGSLVERGRERAKADRLAVTFQEADAEALPFADGSFDVVLSTFGVMFTPNQQQAANELKRVCRPGGKIGMANWTPESFIGQLSKPSANRFRRHPASSRRRSAAARRILTRCSVRTRPLRHCPRICVFRFKSPKHWVEVFRNYYGPVVRAFAAIDPKAQEALEADPLALLDKFDVARDGTLVVPSEYLEVIVTTRG
jgi:ubiquinone/menaquinone biosynthesis C-methylase UbiE